jgi:tRNA(fMet)-specific endonuclease VapC
VVRKICLDSNVIIDFLRNGRAAGLIASLDARFYMTSISVFEIWYGKKEKENVPEFLEGMRIFSFDEKAAILAAEVLLSLRKSGQLADFKDVFIAAICIQQDLELFTYKVKHFERMKKFGLKLVSAE